jgi:hypothetical protein
MEIWIKYLGDKKHNYTRFGKILPNDEKKISVKKFFSVSEKREKEIVNSLKNDSKLFVKIHKGG